MGASQARSGPHSVAVRWMCFLPFHEELTRIRRLCRYRKVTARLIQEGRETLCLVRRRNIYARYARLRWWLHKYKTGHLTTQEAPHD